MLAVVNNSGNRRMPATEICPKCHYQRQTGDSHVMAGICPACGIAYKKWRAGEVPRPDECGEDESQAQEQEDGGILYDESVVHSLAERLRVQFLSIPEKVTGATLFGRAALWLVFVVWGWSFIFGGISWESIGGSFLHNVILPFHEFGHLLFSPLGRFMGILGGSLFQVLMPLGLMLAFSIQQRDNFAASIMMWWCGQSFIVVSPYIADAPYRAIPLIGGMDESAHDWGNLLTVTDSMGSAMSLARLSFATGSLIMLVAMVWGGWLLWQQKKTLID